MRLTADRIKSVFDERRNEKLFLIYMAVGCFGLLGAFFSDTFPQCVLLILVSAFTFICGFIIKGNVT